MPTTATHGLWYYLSGKVFSQGSFAGTKSVCSMVKCKRYESNIPQQAYKACPITAWVLLQNESERIRTFNILPPACSLSNTRFPCARLPFRHTLLNGISAVSNMFFVLCLSTRKYFLFPKPPGTCDAPLISFPLGGSSIKEVYQKK